MTDKTCQSCKWEHCDKWLSADICPFYERDSMDIIIENFDCIPKEGNHD